MNGCIQKLTLRFWKKYKGIRILCLAAGCLLAFWAGGFLWAQDDAPQIDEFQKKARDIDREIEARRAKIKKFAQKEVDIISALNQVDLGLNKTRKQIAILGREITALEKKNSRYNPGF